ncbi:MAG: hypothetical protein VB859_02795 [Planctomycetaceae bacterium]
MARVCLALLVTACLLPGCGGEPDTPGADGGAGPVAADPAALVTAATGGQQVVRVIDGKKWIGEVPQDVYFPDPLQVATDRRPVGGQAKAANSPAAPKTSTGKDATKSTASATADWKSLITIETLSSEIKKIRNELTGHLQNVGKYNSGMADIPANGATLAVLADVATRHPGKVSWKAKAKFVRDLSAQMFTTELARGRKSYEQVKGPFEKIIEILDGSEPAELPESKDQAVFSDVASFGHVMQRMNRGFKWIQTNARDQESYKENSERVRHEVAILAVMARVIEEEGYGFSDDEDFVKYASQMLKACQTIKVAVKNEKFEDYDKAISAIDQLCTQCHMGRR